MVVKNNRLYSDLAKKLIDYTEEPSKYNKQKMMCSINGQIGGFKKNGREKEVIALEELRKVFRRIK
jgi:hypothetical protein